MSDTAEKTGKWEYRSVTENTPAKLAEELTKLAADDWEPTSCGFTHGQMLIVVVRRLRHATVTEHSIGFVG